MTDSDLTKYDWRRQLGDGGSGVYHERVAGDCTRWDGAVEDDVQLGVMK